MRTAHFLNLALFGVVTAAGCAAPMADDVQVASAEEPLTVSWVDGANNITADVETVGPTCNGSDGFVTLSGGFTATTPATIYLVVTLDGPPPAAEIIVVLDTEFVPSGHEFVAAFEETLAVPDGMHTLDFCFALDAGGRPSTEQGCLSTINSNLACATPVDTTPPNIVGSRAPDANMHGWNNADVTVSFMCDDPESGILSCTAPVVVSSEGAGQSVMGTAVNTVGLTASATVSDINIDKTNPTVSFSGTGTYQVSDTVNVTCSAADSLSGIASSTCADVSGAAYTFGAGTHPVSASATDKADNMGSGSGSFTVRVTTAGLCQLIGQFSSSSFITQVACAKLASIQSDINRGKLWLARIKIWVFRHWLQTTGRHGLSSSEVQTILDLLNDLEGV